MSVALVLVVKVVVSLICAGILMSLVMDGPTDKYLSQQEIDEITNSR